jgi:hypothetical protein
MQLTKRQMEFWTLILVLCIGTAVVVLLLDFGIKAAILEESTRLRLRIEEWERQNGRNPESTNEGGNGNDALDNPPLPSDVLVVDTARMEERSNSNGYPSPARKTSKRRTISDGTSSDNPVQS